jgi:PhoH-like ATPase
LNVPKDKKNSKRLFLLDTNVLIHDPSALFQFQEHDIYLPMVVLEELDGGKKGLTDAARNVRQTNRYLEGLVEKIIDSGNRYFSGVTSYPPSLF